MRDFRKIRAWAEADDLTVRTYELTRSFPKEEVYGLTSQIRRASFSVPSNIAEGSARNSKKEYLHFLYIARGSLTEVQYFAHLASRLGYLSEEDARDLEDRIKSSFVRLHRLIVSVEKETGSLARGSALLTSGIVLCVAGLAHKVIAG